MNPILLTVICLVLVLMGVLSTWRKVPQDKAVAVTGLKKRVITGGGGIVIPIFERTDRISLESMKLEVSVRNALTSQGVGINANGVAIVKVKSETSSILAAIEQFNSSNEESTIQKIKETTQDVLEGKLREIVSTLTVESIYKNREEFSSEVQRVTVEDLASMGLEIKAFTISDLSDDNGYLTALGTARIAEVKRDADIAKAEAIKTTRIKTAEATREGKEAELEAETRIAEAQKDKELKTQEYRKQQETAKAEADCAYQIKENLVKKDVIEAEMQAQLVEKERQIEIARQEALRRQEELDATIRKQAEAEKYRQEKQAEAEKFRKIAEAEAEAESVRVKALVEAEAVRLMGQAEAEAIRLKGEAEAEAMQVRANAYKQYGEAAITELIVSKLPEIAQAIATPMSQIDKIVVIDNGTTDGSNGNGAAKIPAYVTNVISQLPETVEALTGMDLMNVVQTALTKTNSVNINLENCTDTPEVSEEL